MFQQNRNLLIIALIILVGSLGYGIVIPILYTYTQKFGLSDFDNGLLFAIFSVCQFAATPVIGMLSDKLGRRPLLLVSLLGTSVSFFVMAYAPNALLLFVARALDGITAGNIPVAQAVISDTTDPEHRTRGFGIIGASFGFGFIAGPAISAFTIQYGTHVPFLIAGAISTVAVALIYFFLPETNKHIGQTASKKLFDWTKMWRAMLNHDTGLLLLVMLLYSFAFAMFIYAFQPFAVKNLQLSAERISFLFAVFGVIGLVSQLFLVARLTKLFGIKKLFLIALAVLVLSFLWFFAADTQLMFVAGCIVMGLANSTVQPVVQTLLSREADAKEQGEIMGLAVSYMSIGQIFGPIAGGALATIALRYPFLGGGALMAACLWLAREAVRRVRD